MKLQSVITFTWLTSVLVVLRNYNIRASSSRKRRPSRVHMRTEVDFLNHKRSVAHFPFLTSLPPLLFYHVIISPLHLCNGTATLQASLPASRDQKQILPPRTRRWYQQWCSSYPSLMPPELACDETTLRTCHPTDLQANPQRSCDDFLLRQYHHLHRTKYHPIRKSDQYRTAQRDHFRGFFVRQVCSRAGGIFRTTSTSTGAGEPNIKVLLHG